MNLVFFEDAIKHVSRISRILRQPRGNALLVGVGGSGKQSLTRLAAYMADVKCFQLELKRGFGYSEFQDFLKQIMVTAGVEGKQVAFLFTENQILQERFLEDVNNILNSGEVPNLFANDEMQKIVEDLTPKIKELGLPEGRDAVQQAFIQRVRDNLHIVLCMSPVGESFRTRCRKFPSLINCTTIDWFTKWPQQALASVSQRFLKDVELPSDEIRQALSEMCVEIHSSLDATCDRFYAELRRKVYTTPKSYLDLINLYVQLLGEKRLELRENLQRLETGLQKLKDTNEMVVELKAMMEKLQPELKKKTEETTVLLNQVAVDQKMAAEVRAVVEAEEKTVKKQAAEVQAVQADAQADLDLALPALEGALKALDSLKKNDVTEVKSMGKPPEGVVMVMEAVCIMLGEKPDWDTAKKVMANAQFLKMLKEYDKDNINPKMVKKLKDYLNHPLFNEEAMKKVSLAAASLCQWVRAMVVYSKVAADVLPKKQRVEEMNKLLEEANSKLQEKQRQLEEVTEKVAKLRQKCDETVAEKAKLDQQTQQTKNRLLRAEKLTSGLSTEQVRWKQDAEKLTVELQYLVGDVFLSAACISYYGAFTGDYRKALVEKWLAQMIEKDIPVSPTFSLRETLGDPVTIRRWNINGLPTDDVSVDSGILVSRGHRWPLMIDPQGQAKKWIKNEHKNKLLVTRFQDPNMLRTLERGIRNGLPVLIEDVGEEIDASIDGILNKQVFKQGNRLLIHLGENDVDYDPNFRFYMTTKLANPHYLPEVCIKVTLLNFTVTKQGLEDQLLGEVVKKERPDVEEKRNRLIVSMAADKKQLKDIEKRILRMLSESSGMILDDVDLITTLGDSKFTSTVINERMKEAEQTQQDVMEIREKYRPVATRGSILYFVISDLSLMDPMYQYSLDYFMRLFNLCIDQSEPSEKLSRRLENLMTYMTKSIYTNICRGLFESHKLILSFLICVEILRERKAISNEEWLFLLRGGGAMDSQTSNPLSEHFSDETWQVVTSLSTTMSAFDGLSYDILQNPETWIAYASSDQIHRATIPGRWNNLTDFQKLLLLKAFRAEKLMFAFSDFVGNNMGKEYVESTRTRLEDVYKDTDYKTPIIFVLSVGADPTGILMRFAKDMKYSERLQVISLGQGQGENARRLIENATKTGDWVLLQNCHLAKSWMPELEKIIQGFAEKEEKTHDNFRLWLTSMPCDYFPVSVLQTGVKVTNEPPKGLRANLIRSYTNVVNAEEFEQCTKPLAWKKLLFGLCFFHATVQERQKFGPLGWNKKYEFNDSDLETSLQVLRMFLDEQPEIPWDALRYVCGEINYGGRVTDDWDRRCLMAILNRFYTPAILQDSYQFSPSGIYHAPPQGPLPSYLTYLESLPMTEEPEIFGMHENANITFQKQETEKLLTTIISVQPRQVSGGGAKTADELVAECAVEIENNLPDKLDKKNAADEIFAPTANGSLDSLSTVLVQEIDRFNRLLNVLRSSLHDLRRAIKGEVVMSMELDKMYDSFLNNRVPELWARYAYPSLKPLGSWVKDLRQRIAFMDDWLRNGKPPAFWLAGFFFPQGFMTGTLQNHARKYKVPIDSLNFSFTVLDVYERSEIKAPPSDGVYIYGLFLDGARWNMEDHCIDDAPVGQLSCNVPVVHFQPTENFTMANNEYSCPVYKTSVRAGVLSTTGQSTNFVLAVQLPTKRPSDYWVLKGAALLCQLNT